MIWATSTQCIGHFIQVKGKEDFHPNKVILVTFVTNGRLDKPCDIFITSITLELKERARSGGGRRRAAE